MRRRESCYTTRKIEIIDEQNPSLKHKIGIAKYISDKISSFVDLFFTKLLETDFILQ